MSDDGTKRYRFLELAEEVKAEQPLVNEEQAAAAEKHECPLCEVGHPPARKILVIGRVHGKSIFADPSFMARLQKAFADFGVAAEAVANSARELQQKLAEKRTGPLVPEDFSSIKVMDDVAVEPRSPKGGLLHGPVVKGKGGKARRW